MELKIDSNLIRFADRESTVVICTRAILREGFFISHLLIMPIKDWSHEPIITYYWIVIRLSEISLHFQPAVSRFPLTLSTTGVQLSLFLVERIF